MPHVPAALNRWWPAAAGAAVLALALAVPLAGGSEGKDAPAAAASTAAGAEASEAASPAPAPTAPALAPVRAGKAPEAGQVELVAGPFTDRLELKQAQVRTGAKAAVEGSLGQAVDNSALIVAQLQVDFYAADGELLGSRQKVLRQPDISSGGVRPVGGDARYGGDIDFSVEAPAKYADEVSAALLSVPTLVNE